MAKKQITVTLNLPTTEAGRAAMRERVMRMNTQMLVNVLRSIDAPDEVKAQYINSLNGRVPWAAEGKA